MSDSVELYVIEYQIDGRTYAANLPAQNWHHAEAMASALGGKVLGSNVHSIPAVPIPQLMSFISEQADEPIKWKFNAEEQIQAFLACGWPERPQELT